MDKRHALSKFFMNNKYTIKLEAPLLRAGLSIKTTTSERYVVPVLNKLMDLVREFNGTTTERPKAEAGAKNK